MRREGRLLSLASGGTCTLLDLPLLEGDPVTGLNFCSLFLVGALPVSIGVDIAGWVRRQRAAGSKGDQE